MKLTTRLTVRVTVLTCLCFWLTVNVLYAQMRVGQPSGAPDGSAALDVSGGPYSSGSAYRGLLPPKVALTKTTQATPITAPATGLLVYNTAQTGDVTPGYYYWEGSKWARLSTTAPGSGRIGVAGDPVSAYTYNEAKALTTPPGTVFMLTEPGQEGLFRNANTPTSSADTVAPNGIRDANGNILSSGTVMVVGGQRYKRVIDDGVVNVKWFGAVGQSDGTDDAPAIQQAINYAKSLVNNYGNVSNVATVLIPPGNFRILKTLDLTNCNGVIIKGNGGRYNNTSLIGNTGGLMLDFTGATFSGCENLFIRSLANEPNPSTIGIQFALATSGGGLSSTLKNCFILMADLPSANNGLGSIGLLNCRAEEFAVADCRFQANVGCIFSYAKNLADAGYSNFTVNSPAIATGTGSMGVVNFSGQNSIVNYGKAQPALILNGTNSVNFHGYLGRASTTGSGTNEAAILATYSTTNFNFNGTVESFAQLLRIKGEFQNCTINAVVANQVNNSSVFPAGTTRHPVINVYAANIGGCKISVAFGENEIDNRYLLYDAGQPNNPVFPTSSILNSEIISPRWQNNNLAVSANLLKNTENTSFKTATPFEKKSGALTSEIVNAQTISTAGWTPNSYNQIVPTGTLATTKVYVMKVIWGQNGVDQVVQSYMFAMSGTDYNTNSAAQMLPVITPNTVISWSNTGRAISIRYKAPASYGQTTYGLEAAITKSDMNNGNLSITIAPLL